MILLLNRQVDVGRAPTIFHIILMSHFQNRSKRIKVQLAEQMSEERSNNIGEGIILSNAPLHCPYSQTLPSLINSVMFLLFISCAEVMPTTPRDRDVSSVNMSPLPYVAIENPIWKSHQIWISSFFTSNRSRRLLHSYLISTINLAYCRAQTGRNRIIHDN